MFELGSDQGRRTIDAAQSGPAKKLTVDFEDTTVPGGPSGHVSVRILCPQGARRPLRASLEQLAGLPPALVITAEADVVGDEGEAYADRLRERCCPTSTEAPAY